MLQKIKTINLETNTDQLPPETLDYKKRIAKLEQEKAQANFDQEKSKYEELVAAHHVAMAEVTSLEQKRTGALRESKQRIRDALSQYRETVTLLATVQDLPK